MRGYKVLARTGERLVSVGIRPGLVYHLEKWTHPNKGHGPLGVFPSLVHAQSMMQAFREETFLYGPDKSYGIACRYLIFACEYQPSNENRFWQLRSDGSRIYDYKAPKKGCIFASGIRLLNEKVAK